MITKFENSRFKNSIEVYEYLLSKYLTTYEDGKINEAREYFKKLEQIYIKKRVRDITEDRYNNFKIIKMYMLDGADIPLNTLKENRLVNRIDYVRRLCNLYDN